MPEMFCPQCGQELELDSGEMRFCRYCGFALGDTKDALRGYSRQKRMGFSIVTWSYALLLVLTLLLHGGYVSLDTRWVYWLVSILIVVSVSLFTSAAVSGLKPSVFSKSRREKDSRLKRNSANAETNPLQQNRSLPAINEPVNALNPSRRDRETVEQPRSVIEGTTRKLSDR